MVLNISLTVVAWALSLRTTIVDMVKHGESGQDFLEYAVLVGGIAIVAAGVFLIGGGALDFSQFFDTIQSCLNFNDGMCE